jgi:hypothetical protein
VAKVMPQGRPFQKGQSGNPGGKPKAIKAVEELARSHTADAIGTLAEIMKNSEAPAAARVTAASTLLDRGWGKARQEVQIGGEIDVRSLGDAELDQALRDELAALIGGTHSGAGEAEDRGQPH